MGSVNRGGNGRADSNLVHIGREDGGTFDLRESLTPIRIGALNFAGGERL
jgi:hypothetical protein